MEGWRRVCGEGGLHREGEMREEEEAANHGESCQHGWDMRSGKGEGVGKRASGGLGPQEGRKQVTPRGMRCTQ